MHMSPLSFPPAQQAQITNQRDLYHVSSLRDQTETVLRSWLGTRWLTRWDKEVELLVKLAYHGITTGRAMQTLGEEYTDIWQSSGCTPPSFQTRTSFVLLSALSAYALNRFKDLPLLRGQDSRVKGFLRAIPAGLGFAVELNLAIFYLRGTYHDVVKRLFGIRYLSLTSEDPHTRPPSYSLLGILILVRLLHRLITGIQSRINLHDASSKGERKLTMVSKSREAYLDERPVSLFLGPVNPEGEPARPAEEDERTMLDVKCIPEALRASRNCTLCLEERTDSCSTECGHLFCWSCIVGWGTEKSECPLCRQSLNLTRLLPIYNL